MEKDEQERLRTLTVEVMLALRAAYLGSPGANALKHWDLLRTRLLSAVRTSQTPEEWVTSMCRRLQLPTLNSSASSAVADLADHVRERGNASDWLSLVEREHGYLMALTRRAAEQRREAREKESTK